MQKSYLVTGTFNAHPVKTKAFKTSDKAFKYLDKIIEEYNIQIEEVYNVGANTTTFVVNNYTRFTLEKMA